MAIRTRRTTYILQQQLQLVELAALDQHMLVIDVFDDEVVVVLVVDAVDDGLDGGVALH